MQISYNIKSIWKRKYLNSIINIEEEKTGEIPANGIQGVQSSNDMNMMDLPDEKDLINNPCTMPNVAIGNKSFIDSR